MTGLEAHMKIEKIFDLLDGARSALDWDELVERTPAVILDTIYALSKELDELC